MTRAMLLCAGLSTRLGELGQKRPKPLLPVCDIPILRYGISNLKSFHEKTWVFERYYLAKLMGGTGGERSDLYDDRSAINFVDDVRRPMLILQGDIDIVCHRSEMDNMVAALEKAGKDVEYKVYDGEGHGWKMISTIIDDANRSEAFLLRAVMDG